MGGPEVGLVRPRNAQLLIERKALAGCAALRVPRQRAGVRNTQQLVRMSEQAGLDSLSVATLIGKFLQQKHVAIFGATLQTAPQVARKTPRQMVL